MSGILRVKLRRDMRASWSRLALMVLAITVSLAAFAAVLFAWSAARRETGAAYASTSPASATIVLDQPVDAPRMAALAAQAAERPDVLEATGRTQFTADLEVGGRPVDIPLQAFVATPDDPMRLATFHVDTRSWPSSVGEIFLSGDSLGLLEAAVGDTITARMPDGRRIPLRIAATVYDPSLSPSPQEQLARGYLSAASLSGPGGMAPLDQLKLQIAQPGTSDPSADRAVIVAAAAEVGQWLRRDQGLTVREIQVPPPLAHPHQWQADALLAALLAGAAATLLLSSVLTATMLHNLFTLHIPQIGIMKAIGARTGRVGRFYLTMVLAIAGVATALALGPATWLGRTAVDVFLNLLGIRPASLSPPLWTYAIVIGLGVGLPTLIGLVPVVKATRTTVRAAIDHRGAGAPSKASGLAARLGLRGVGSHGLAMAVRNTVRRPARFLLAAGLLATAGMVFIAAMSLSSGTEAVVETKKEQRSWDVDAQLSGPGAVDRIQAVVAAVPGVTRVEALAVVPAGIAGPGQIPVTRTYPDQGHGRVSVTALPATVPAPTLLEGRWLTPGETGAVVLNQVTRTNTLPGARPGDTVQLIVAGRSTTWRIAGIVEESGHGSGVYTTIDGYAAAMNQPPAANQLRITTAAHDEQTRQDTAAAVERALTGAGIGVASANSISRSEAITQGHFGPIVLILLGIALPLGVVGVVGLAATMSANVLDRTREFGVLHAIGARPRTVRRIVTAEGVLVAAASYLIAIPLALGLAAILGRGLGELFFDAPLPYRVSTPAALLWLGIVVLGSVLATETAATRASRISVREALTAL
ncbi:ABC transporter permease [Micromonospora purpureochromogenes]|uniref:ABC transport system permease protein n=1 Tax=Micromonospora purpureochromogenes TaxID=47872 RepID=A0ABX2RT87_9ACTN|nr:ABC transporter permease [Micromonospora purpureochromogenes]NYF59737.1 putative ABC transport system permease protein [Micromonospora purpureochromogenes]